jgi:hypothetical protein
MGRSGKAEFSSQQALQSYLRQHPKADASKHSVAQAATKSAAPQEAKPEVHPEFSKFVSTLYPAIAAGHLSGPDSLKLMAKHPHAPAGFEKHLEGDASKHSVTGGEQPKLAEARPSIKRASTSRFQDPKGPMKWRAGDDSSKYIHTLDGTYNWTPSTGHLSFISNKNGRRTVLSKDLNPRRTGGFHDMKNEEQAMERVKQHANR